MGRGLGLGLAISSSIASDAGGALTARNAPSGGALFVLTLRRARTHHPDSVSEPAARARRATPPARRRTIGINDAARCRRAAVRSK